jgi:uncharacterized protein YndB with AHSA1/START domain/biotin operon repressor
MPPHPPHEPGTPARTTLPSGREIRVERTFAAPRALVWRAYTEPQLIAQWYCRGHFVVVERFEPVRGGHWRIVEYADDGVHGFEGRYREVAPPERLVMTFDWDGMPGYPVIETYAFEDLGDGRTRRHARQRHGGRHEREFRRARPAARPPDVTPTPAAPALDRTFSALADPTRRGILERLARSDASIGELAEGFGMTRTGVAKHVRLLEEAGLVGTRKAGRVRTVTVGPQRLDDVRRWVDAYRTSVEARLDRLEALLERLQREA